MAGKRVTAISWDEAFMGVAELIRQRSKDPSTQVGACVVTSDNRILSLGYNGSPNGFDDDDFPWIAEGDDDFDTKYPYVIHAERNAIANYAGSRREFAGGTMYVTHSPCNECAKEIVQSGIKKVVYLNDWEKRGVSSFEATVRIFSKTGVVLEKLVPSSYLVSLGELHANL